ncbi:DMT family transporter [Algimonas porphyrae]|uniref:EamA domain-containing protein n=1 Tax=Algimonas porphyrae TaxID=1128113 RepID=A0ABQ5UWG4_9PROT|nr:DMT family transporter [Algimonas porphyrae]GLQ19616.1 hypothetical protein GCM10007854_05710 [Algimonas porphyrae]
MISLRQTIWLTGFALIAFAGNSVLARLALVGGSIDVVSFTAIRILSGALVLAALVGIGRTVRTGRWSGALSLLAYAALFSLAYLRLDTGMGALILFASVQITMIGWGFRSGERMGPAQLVGVGLALCGLVWLLLPGLSRPDPLAAVAMILSGVGWGIYSLLGRAAGRPTEVTAGNFARAALLGVPVYALAVLVPVEMHLSTSGVILAIASGALTSGLGYAVWYRALKGLSATRGGIVQLAVPPLSALGGVVLLSEPLTIRFVLASAIILIGIALAILGRSAYANSK